MKKVPGFITPVGNYVSRNAMAKALRVIRNNPEADNRGWEWYPTPGYVILAAHKRARREIIDSRSAKPE